MAKKAKEKKKQADKTNKTTSTAQSAAETEAPKDIDAKIEEAQQKEAEVLNPEEKAAEELAEAKDKYLRLYSEFENFRRRNARERIDLVKTASSDLISALLPIIDDFQRAEQANEKQQDVEVIKEGVGLIYSKLFKTLEAKGLKRMETEKGTAFDPDLHEAVTRFPVEDEALKGKIIDTVEQGYYLADKVIRFAKVVIGA